MLARTLFFAVSGSTPVAFATVCATPSLPSQRSVLTGPGETSLMRMPRGPSSCVLLGAGFDTRGLRLAEIAACQASVYEVDFAEQLEKKRALLDAAGVRLPARIAAVGCDFMAPGFDDSLLVALGQSGFRQGERALFVWEGVIAYIDAGAVDRSLRFVVNAGGRGSRLAFDFAAGITFDSEPPAERLRGTGFTAFKAVGFDELWRRYRQPGEPHTNASIMQMGVAEV